MTRSSESPQPPTDRQRERKRESQLLVWGTEQTLAVGMVGLLFSFSCGFPHGHASAVGLILLAALLLWLNYVAVISPFPDIRRRRWHRSILSLRRRRNYFNLSILCSCPPEYSTSKTVFSPPHRSGGMIAAIPPLLLRQLPQSPSGGWRRHATCLSSSAACVPVCAVHTQSSYRGLLNTFQKRKSRRKNDQERF